MATQEVAPHSSEATQASEPLLGAPTSVTSDNVYDDQDRSKGHYDFESPPRPWWKGNINVYLGAVYIYMIWYVTITCYTEHYNEFYSFMIHRKL